MLCWHKAASALCRGAFISLILVCGLTLSAVKIEKRGLAIGDEPRTGLQGANDVVYDYGGEGPGEQMVSLASEMAMALHFNDEMKLRVVIRGSFRLRLDAARDFFLQSARKR